MTCVKFRRDLEIPVSALEYQNLWVFLIEQKYPKLVIAYL